MMHTVASTLLAVVMVLSTLAATATAETRPLGILKRQAPSWEVTQWFQLPDGKTSLDVDDFKGKVVYLYCFQSWCPGCHSHGFPTLQKLTNHYANDPNVAFVAIQTTFEGYGFNTFSKAKATIDRYDLTVPTGQSGDPDMRSRLMQSYRTGGTPWTIIIDKQGVVRFNNYHIQAAQAIQLIEYLK